MPKAKKQTSNPVLDQFVGAISGRGARNVATLVRDVLNVERPTTDQVANAILLFKDDGRFMLTDAGVLESTVRMADEPEDITAAATASADRPAPTLSGEECGKLADEANGVSATRTAISESIQTIGEALEQTANDLKAHGTLEVEVVETVEVASSEDTATLARLKQVKAGIDAQANTIHHLSEDLKEHKKRLEVLEAERDQLIDGEIPPTQMGTKDPSQTPVGRAISGKAPMIVEPPVEGLYRQQGATMAAQGRTELDCPYVRETNARGVSMWFDGFREAKREDHSEREAQVQALFRDALVIASTDSGLDYAGLMPPGEEVPKISTVEFDKRPHLVVGMCAADENPSGLERWSLVPCFSKQEWAETFAETYGPAIKGVDRDDEAKANRQKGGVDAGRVFKSGRKTLVAGPLARLTVATVKPDEQPKF